MQEWAGFEKSRIISRRSVDKRQTTVVSNDLAGGEQKRNSIVCVMQRLYLWWHKFFYIGRQYFESHAGKRAKINPQNNFLRIFFFFFDAEKWSKTSTVIKNGTWWILLWEPLHKVLLKIFPLGKYQSKDIVPISLLLNLNKHLATGCNPRKTRACLKSVTKTWNIS